MHSLLVFILAQAVPSYVSEPSSRLMEVSNPTGSGSKDATQPPSLPLVLPLTNAYLLPSPAKPHKLAMFQQLILAVERSNAMKK